MDIKDSAVQIVQRLQNEGHTTYFAGGWVRDFLLGLPSDDIDIATSASTSQIRALFSKTIPVGEAFGIVIVVENGHQFEVATFRKESGYLDGRRPSHIEPATPQEDALRRDFTINGLFFDPITDQLLDFVQGQQDLKNKVLRAIGDPHHRFLEDRLRMIRAVRYSMRFGFPIELATQQAILSHAKSLFPSVAIERVWQELTKMSRSPHFPSALHLLYELKLLTTIFPDIRTPPTLSRPYDPSQPLILQLLPLFTPQAQSELADYLKLSRKDSQSILFYQKAQRLLTLPPSWQQSLERSEWAHFYADPLSDFCLSHFEAPPFHTSNQQQLVPHILRIRNKDPLIKAQDLLLEGIPPSPTLGLLLQEAQRLSINNLTEDKALILSKLRESTLWETPS